MSLVYLKLTESQRQAWETAKLDFYNREVFRIPNWNFFTTAKKKEIVQDFTHMVFGGSPRTKQLQETIIH